MKNLPLLALVFLQIVARADMIIVQKVDGTGQSGEMTMKFKDVLTSGPSKGTETKALKEPEVIQEN